jgi:hypothetical protein
MKIVLFCYTHIHCKFLPLLDGHGFTGLHGFSGLIYLRHIQKPPGLRHKKAISSWKKNVEADFFGACQDSAPIVIPKIENFGANKRNIPFLPKNVRTNYGILTTEVCSNSFCAYISLNFVGLPSSGALKIEGKNVFFLFRFEFWQLWCGLKKINPM